MSVPSLTLAYLADHPGLAWRLAELHYAEWGHYYTDWSVELAHAELQAHVGRRQIPTTIVALAGNELLGSASLVVGDLEGYEHLTPWLASLFVLPEHRGHGIGKTLVHAVVNEATALRIPELHLWTVGQRSYYERLGWEFVELCQRSHGPIAIMRHGIILPHVTPAG